MSTDCTHPECRNMFECERPLKDILFARDPGQWPVWPILPLKRRNGDIFADDGLGVLVDAEGYETTVFVSCAFMPITTATPRKSYDTLEDLFAEWTVD